MKPIPRLHQELFTWSSSITTTPYGSQNGSLMRLAAAQSHVMWLHRSCLVDQPWHRVRTAPSRNYPYLPCATRTFLHLCIFHRASSSQHPAPTWRRLVVVGPSKPPNVGVEDHMQHVAEPGLAHSLRTLTCFHRRSGFILHRCSLRLLKRTRASRARPYRLRPLHNLCRLNTLGDPSILSGSPSAEGELSCT